MSNIAILSRNDQLPDGKDKNMKSKDSKKSKYSKDLSKKSKKMALKIRRSSKDNIGEELKENSASPAKDFTPIIVGQQRDLNAEIRDAVY